MNKNNIFQDFDIYTRSLINSKDCDPTYPLISEIIKEFKYQPEWFVFVYVAFYNIGTAIKMCNFMPTINDWDRNEFRKMRISGELKDFGHERRGTARNIENQVRMFDEIIALINLIDTRKHPLTLKKDKIWFQDNKQFRELIHNLSYHSSWASFKIAELFEKSLGYEQFTIHNLGLEGRDPNSNDGPIGGLKWLFGRDNEYDKKWFNKWDEFGYSLSLAYNYDLGEIETALCKFHKLNSGKYYISHDVSEFHELKGTLSEDIYYRMMNKIFDKELIEDIDKRNGLDKSLKSLYMNQGVIYNNHYADKTNSVDVLDILMSL